MNGPRIEVNAEVPLEGTYADMCVVTLGDVRYASTEFVAILAKADGDVGFYYNADALTMGMSMQMCARAFSKMMEELQDNERNEIRVILGGSANE